ncbi:hypothetical protein BEN74_06570 [Acinetobacter sp. WCHAc010034]|nr:hypothetical protein BEN74_06570 [Acinetobacter sp. WCHAc010034]
MRGNLFLRGFPAHDLACAKIKQKNRQKLWRTDFFVLKRFSICSIFKFQIEYGLVKKNSLEL